MNLKAPLVAVVIGVAALVASTAGAATVTKVSSGVDLGFKGAAVVTTDLRFIRSAAPEPDTWALMMVGVGVAGAALRGRRSVRSAQA